MNKILEFAGFTEKKLEHGKLLIDSYWIDNNGLFFSNNEPELTLDFLDKYVVPKLREEGFAIQIYGAYNFDVWQVLLLSHKGDRNEYDGINNDLTEALTQAVEKYLEGRE